MVGQQQQQQQQGTTTPPAFVPRLHSNHVNGVPYVLVLLVSVPRVHCKVLKKVKIYVLQRMLVWVFNVGGKAYQYC